MKNIFKSEKYLDITYSDERAPVNSYPFKLGKYLLEKHYKGVGKILDIGCGRGDYLDVFKHYGCESHGLDISPNIKRLEQEHVVKFCDLEVEKFPYKEGTFDFVFSKSVIEHLQNPTNLFSNAHECLKDDGVAVIMTPSWEYNYWGPFYIDYTHVTPFTKPSLADAMRFSGFKDVEVYYFYQLPFVWKYPYLKFVCKMIAASPLKYRPFHEANWPESINKVIRFSKEVMLVAVGRK